MFGAVPTKISQSLMMVSTSVPALPQIDGSIFMLRKDFPFPLPIAVQMTSRAQSATIMKSSQYQNGV
jgi:hypothetical protein